MALERTRLGLPSLEACLPVYFGPNRTQTRLDFRSNRSSGVNTTKTLKLRVSAVDRGNKSGGGGGDGSTDINSGGSIHNNNNNNHNKKGSPSPSSNYVVPLGKSSCITRPLAEILRDLNKRIPDNIIKSTTPHPHDQQDDAHPIPTFIPWYHANRMLSFYAPGWCGEIRDVIFSDNGSVTVVYRVTIRGSDGEAHRESTGTISSSSARVVDPVAAAEEIAFCRACARFGLGLYLYHD